MWLIYNSLKLGAQKTSTIWGRTLRKSPVTTRMNASTRRSAHGFTFSLSVPLSEGALHNLYTAFLTMYCQVWVPCTKETHCSQGKILQRTNAPTSVVCAATVFKNDPFWLYMQRLVHWPADCTSHWQIFIYILLDEISDMICNTRLQRRLPVSPEQLENQLQKRHLDVILLILWEFSASANTSSINKWSFLGVWFNMI